MPFSGFVTEGATLVDYYLGNNQFYIKLFKNDVTPTIDTVDTDLTEADFVGYSYKYPNSVPNTAGDGYPEEVFNAAVFQFTGGSGDPSQVVYGWWIEWYNGTSPNKVHYAERFASPITMAAGSPEIAINLTDKFGV